MELPGIGAYIQNKVVTQGYRVLFLVFHAMCDVVD